MVKYLKFKKNKNKLIKNIFTKKRDSHLPKKLEPFYDIHFSSPYNGLFWCFKKLYVEPNNRKNMEFSIYFNTK